MTHCQCGASGGTYENSNVAVRSHLMIAIQLSGGVNCGMAPCSVAQSFRNDNEKSVVNTARNNRAKLLSFRFFERSMKKYSLIGIFYSSLVDNKMKRGRCSLKKKKKEC